MDLGISVCRSVYLCVGSLLITRKNYDIGFIFRKYVETSCTHIFKKRRIGQRIRLQHNVDCSFPNFKSKEIVHLYNMGKSTPSIEFYRISSFLELKRVCIKNFATVEYNFPIYLFFHFYVNIVFFYMVRMCFIVFQTNCEPSNFCWFLLRHLCMKMCIFIELCNLGREWQSSRSSVRELRRTLPYYDTK